jgi:hypothetical protein
MAFTHNNPFSRKSSPLNTIKPENRGKFTKWAEGKGMGVAEAANTVMRNKEDYTTNVVQMANFAKNAQSWNK